MGPVWVKTARCGDSAWGKPDVGRTCLECEGQIFKAVFADYRSAQGINYITCQGVFPISSSEWVHDPLATARSCPSGFRQCWIIRGY